MWRRWCARPTATARNRRRHTTAEFGEMHVVREGVDPFPAMRVRRDAVGSADNEASRTMKASLLV